VPTTANVDRAGKVPLRGNRSAMAAKGGAGAQEDGEHEGMAKLCEMHDRLL
jgi:hypothetical protein